MRFTSRKSFIQFINLLLSLGYSLVDYTFNDLIELLKVKLKGKYNISKLICSIVKQGDMVIITLLDHTLNEYLEVVFIYG